MTVKNYITDIRDAIASSHTDKALDILKEMADALDVAALRDEHASLSSQYARLRHIDRSGIIGLNEYNLTLNTVNRRIIDLLSDYQEGRLIHRPNGTDKGRIVHNIPSKMIPLEAVLCCVRIAKDDEILFDQDFHPSDNSQPESLTISGEMMVQIVDPLDGGIFEITRIPPGSTGIQQIKYDEYTEWNFRIKPLKQGVYALWLFASTVVDGKEKQKKFFKNIEISADAGEIMQPWQQTDVVFEAKEAESAKKKRGVIAWFSSLGAMSLALLGIATAAALGFVAFLLLQSSEINPVLVIDDNLLVKTVEVNGEIYKTWTANKDSSEITLSDLEVGKEYTFVIKGSNGTCIKQLTLEKKQHIIPMDCEILPDSIAPVLLLEGMNKIGSININGVPVSHWTANEDTTAIFLPPVKIDRQYNFEVNASNGQCTSTAFITLDSFLTNMHCILKPLPITVVPPTSDNRFTVRLRIKRDLLGNVNQNNLSVWIDPIQREVGNATIDGDYLVFKAGNLAAGGYTFKLNGLGSQAKCNYIRHRLNLNVTLDFDCERTPSFTVLVVVPKAAHPANGFNKMRIKIDGNLSPVIPMEHPPGSLFILKGVSRGQHTFELLNANPSYECQPITAHIQSGKSLKFRCTRPYNPIY